MKTVILGSGATFGTLPDGPTTDGFGCALGARMAAQGKDWQQEYRSLAKVVADVRPEGPGWDLAEVWIRIDYFSKLPRLRDGGDYGPNASFDVHAAVLEVYGQQLCGDLDGLLANARPFTLKDIVAGLEPGDALVSFNWDVVSESIANYVHVNLVQAPRAANDSSVQLIKPHGSVSWRHRWPQRSVDMCATPAPCTSPLLPHEVRQYIQPFVVGAVPVKSELIREVQGDGPSSPYTVLVEQWATFMEAIVNADDVVVAGYGFPNDDAYGRFLIQEAVARRTKAIHRLCFYERECAHTAMSATLSKLFKVVSPEWLGPVTLANKALEPTAPERR